MEERAAIVGTAARDQLTAAGRIAVRKELARLPELLDSDERKLEMARGALKGRFGLVAVTERRLIFVDHALIDSRTTAFDLAAVETLRCGVTPMGYGEIRLKVAGDSDGERRFKILPKGRAPELASAVSVASPRLANDGVDIEEFDDESTEMAAPETDPDQVPSASIEIAAQSIEEQMADLEAMKSAGLLTDEAYQSQRERLEAQE